MSLGITYPGLRNGFPFQIHHAMEDGTLFAEWDFSGTGDVDGFPPARYVGAGTLYPIGYTLEEVTEFYWRTRIWDFAASVTIAIPDNYYVSEATSSGSDTYRYEASAISAEIKMIQSPTALTHGPSLGIATEGTGTFTISPPDIEEPFVYTAFQFADAQVFYVELRPDSHTMRFFDGLYWPITWVYVIHVWDLIGSSGIDSLSYYDGTAWPTESLIYAEIFGKPLKMYEAAGVNATGTITLNPSEWWGYGGKFDTTTGARL